MMTRRLHGWTLLAVSAPIVAAAGLAVALWPRNPWVLVPASICGAVFGVAGARGRTLLDRHAEHRAALPDSLLLSAPGGRPPRVRDLDDPLALRVHPAEMYSHDVAGRTVRSRVPPYVPRDADQHLLDAVRQGGLVLIVGDSTAGKTRAAYEAIRAHLTGHTFLAPVHRDALARVIPAAAELRRGVVWLDDLERFLGVGGLTAAGVARITSGARRNVLVIATLRSSEFDRLSAPADTTEAARSTWRDARDVLGLATIVELHRRWSGDELARAQEHSADPRIRAALRHADRFGVAELLAAGPDLVQVWRAGWSPGGHPRGAALVAAAVDCRRAGVHDPLPISFLAELCEHYLAARGGELLRPEPLEEAVRWAMTAAHDASSLLLPTPVAGEALAFDYLIDVDGLDRVPQPIWESLIARATPAQAFDIGESAAQRFLNDVAVLAFRKAAGGGITDADVGAALYARLLVGGRASLDVLTGLWQQREHAFGPDAPATLRARLSLAEALADGHDRTRADLMFRTLVPDLERILGPDDAATLTAQRLHGYALAKLGRFDESRALLHKSLRDHERVYGPDHHDTVLTRHYIASFLAEDEPDAALRLLEGIRDDYQRLMGADSPRVLQARTMIEQIVGCSGDVAHASQLARELATDRERILGLHHAHTLASWIDAAAWAHANGDSIAARTILTRILPAGADLTTAVHAVAGDIPASRERIEQLRLAARYTVCRDLLGADHPLSTRLAERQRSTG
ncbi:tetratricopeptide repeat protein [Dactylosporangium sp. NPDC051484]|uniref:tetratricopeptide repeat protein n=1 Tax=Dactylosporangium sp. NPDC051484 TaxID=3154942 RepID=UPI00344D8D80